MTATPRFWAVIPAAGAGSRMQMDLPKQYLAINGRRIIEYSLEVFCTHRQITGVFVAVAAADKLWDTLAVARHPKIKTVQGGKERCHSVLNCLQALSAVAGAEDWVLVHDAARPCINGQDIDQMIATLRDHPVGGLSALPVRDTMKRGDNTQENGQHVQQTIDRQGLWHALTPQMFRVGKLSQALEQTIRKGILVTDESQAMELAGFRPRLVEGRAENIKVTCHSDLKSAEVYLLTP